MFVYKDYIINIDNISYIKRIKSGSYDHLDIHFIGSKDSTDICIIGEYEILEFYKRLSEVINERNPK